MVAGAFRFPPAGAPPPASASACAGQPRVLCRWGVRMGAAAAVAVGGSAGALGGRAGAGRRAEVQQRTDRTDRTGRTGRVASLAHSASGSITAARKTAANKAVMVPRHVRVWPLLSLPVRYAPECSHFTRVYTA